MGASGTSGTEGGRSLLGDVGPTPNPLIFATHLQTEGRDLAAEGDLRKEVPHHWRRPRGGRSHPGAGRCFYADHMQRLRA